MFNKSDGDRFVVQIVIDVNLTKLGESLSTGIRDVPLDAIQPLDDVYESFRIDVIPHGTESSIFFFQDGVEFSQELRGQIDFEELGNCGASFADTCFEYEIRLLEWFVDGDNLAFSVNNKLVMLVPLEDAVSLQLHGHTSYAGDDTEEKHISVVSECSTMHFDINKMIFRNGVNFSNQFLSTWFVIPGSMSERKLRDALL